MTPDPIPSGTGDPAALLEQIRGSIQEASYTLYGEGMAVIPRRHLDGLLGLAAAGLKLADDWDAEAKRLLDVASEVASETGGAPGTKNRGWAHLDCAEALREAIAAALAGEAGDDGK